MGPIRTPRVPNEDVCRGCDMAPPMSGHQLCELCLDAETDAEIRMLAEAARPGARARRVVGDFGLLAS